MTHCLILAAGQGTRLRPLTDNLPKALVSLLNKPLIMHQIETLESAGINNIKIVTGYESKKLKVLGYPTVKNNLFRTTNMIESLFCARNFLNESKEDILISYGDIVYEKQNLEIVLNTIGDIVVMVDDGWLDLWSERNEDPLNDAETLKIDKKGNIYEIGEKPNSLDDIDAQYTGLIKISHDKIENLIAFYDSLNKNFKYNKKPFKQMYMTAFLQLLIDANWSVKPAHINHGWLEVDTLEDLKLYERLFSEGTLDALWKVS